MPNCENCGAKWSWGDAFKISFLNKRKCPECGKMQYVNSDLPPQKYIPLIIVMLIAPLIRAYLNIPNIVYILFFVVLSLLALIFLPYATKLQSQPKQAKNEDKPAN